MILIAIGRPGNHTRPKGFTADTSGVVVIKAMKRNTPQQVSIQFPVDIYILLDSYNLSNIVAV